MSERRIKAKAANNIVVFTQATRMHEGGEAKYIIRTAFKPLEANRRTNLVISLGPRSLGKKPGYAVHALRCTG